MLLELEQECLEVYMRKVDQANRCRAQLRQAIADSEAELAAICSAMGEPPVHVRQDGHCSSSFFKYQHSIRKGCGAVLTTTVLILHYILYKRI